MSDLSSLETGQTNANAVLEVQISMRTPLWTGGIDGTCDRVHETGLIGSLRWWYEAIVRGLGGSACDPSQHSCGFSEERYRRSKAIDQRERLREAGLCDACQIFGATGWRRRFRLEVVEDQTKLVWTPPPDLLNVCPPGRSRGWFLPPGRMGRLTLRFIGEEKTLQMLAALMRFLEEWGMIGAKPQLGYGVFRIENQGEVGELARQWVWEEMGQGKPSPQWPDLRRFIFFRYCFHPSNSNWWLKVAKMVQRPEEKEKKEEKEKEKELVRLVRSLADTHRTIPVVPALKNEWRFRLWKGSQDQADRIFGCVRKGKPSSKTPKKTTTIRIRSKVTASWAYSKEADKDWEIRGFIWLPEESTADAMLQILSDSKAWRRAVSVSGELTLIPQSGLQSQSTRDIVEFLRTVLSS